MTVEKVSLQSRPKILWAKPTKPNHKDPRSKFSTIQGLNPLSNPYPIHGLWSGAGRQEVACQWAGLDWNGSSGLVSPMDVLWMDAITLAKEFNGLDWFGWRWKRFGLVWFLVSDFYPNWSSPWIFFTRQLVEYCPNLQCAMVPRFLRFGCACSLPPSQPLCSHWSLSRVWPELGRNWTAGHATNYTQQH